MSMNRKTGRSQSPAGKAGAVDLVIEQIIRRGNWDLASLIILIFLIAVVVHPLGQPIGCLRPDIEERPVRNRIG